MDWKLASLGLAVVVGYLVFVRDRLPRQVARGTALETGDPRGTVAHALAVVQKGAKAVAEEGKRAILGEVKAEQRETDKKRMVGG